MHAARANGRTPATHPSLAWQAEQDLSTTLQLLTPAGVLRLPLRALVRRALPTLHAPGGVVEVGGRGGGVMVAARAGRSVMLANSGALDVAYEIKARASGPRAGTGRAGDTRRSSPAAGGSGEAT